MAKRLQIGNVLEIGVQGGFVYLLYIGKHVEYGDSVCVCPAVMAQRVSPAETLFEESYVAFYPAHAALARGFASVVGRIPAPPMPRVLRRPGVRSEKKVDTWIIENESGEIFRRDLTELERQIPVAAIWNHELLLQRISEGWRPDRET